MRVIALAGALLLAGCGPSAEELQDRIAELEDEYSALRDQLDAAHSEATEATDQHEQKPRTSWVS